MLLMLEDNAERVERFTATIQRVAPDLTLRIWRDAWQMISDLKLLMPLASVISLDHDLEPEHESSSDPGTGLDVAEYLAPLPPCCPIIIHTSNGECGNWMVGKFEITDWDYHRIAPLGDDWIERDWCLLVVQLIPDS